MAEGATRSTLFRLKPEAPAKESDGCYERNRAWDSRASSAPSRTQRRGECSDRGIGNLGRRRAGEAQRRTGRHLSLGARPAERRATALLMYVASAAFASDDASGIVDLTDGRCISCDLRPFHVLTRSGPGTKLAPATGESRLAELRAIIRRWPWGNRPSRAVSTDGLRAGGTSADATR